MIADLLDLMRAAWRHRLGRWVLLVLAFLVVYGVVWLTLPVWVALLDVLRITLPVWSSFLLALLFAYLLDPVVTWIGDRGLGRGGAIALMVVAFVAFVGLLWLLGLTIAANLSTMVRELPGLMQGLQDLPFRLARNVDPSYGNLFQQVYVSVQGWVDRLMGEVLPSLEQVEANAVAQQVVSVLGGGFQLVMTVALTIFFLYRFRVYARSFLRVVPERHRGEVREVAVELGDAVGGYVRGQLFIALVVGVLSWIGLTLLGIPLSAALGVLAGLLNIVPFFGPILVSIPTLLIALTVGWPQAIGALIVLFVVNQLDAHVLSPIVFSHTVEIDPATIILAVFLGTVLFGLIGAILAVPAAVMLRFFYRRNYLGSAWYRGETLAHADSDAA